jgi:hypothetical protein
MDPARVTQAYGRYGNVITWAAHLEVVDHLATWDPDELLELQESLVDHLAAGMWVRTTVGRVVDMPDGSAANADSIGATISAMPDHGYEEAWRARDQTPVEVPADRIGLPVDPWASIGPGSANAPRTGGRYTAALRSIRRTFNETNRVMGDDGVLLRAAPWAYHRITGERMDGYEPDWREETFTHRATEPQTYSTRSILQRGPDRVEIIGLRWRQPTAEIAAWRWGKDYSLKVLLRRLGARRVGSSSVQLVGGEFSPADGPQEGQLISQSPVSARAPANALFDELRSMIDGSIGESGHPPLDEDRFWAMIEILGGVVDGDRLEALTRALSKKPRKTILGFQETLARQLHRLDRPELLPDPYPSGRPPMSADVFLHFRCAIVAAGPAAIEGVLAGGPISEDVWLPEAAGGLLHVANDALARQTAFWNDIRTTVRWETGSNELAWGVSEVADGAERYVVRGVIGDAEVIQAWRTSSPLEAIRRHRAANPGSQIDPQFDVIPHASLLTRGLAVLPATAVWFARPLESHQ